MKEQDNQMNKEKEEKDNITGNKSLNQNSNFKKCAQIYNFKLFNIIEIMELLTKNSKLFDQEMNPQSLLQNASI